MLTAKMKQGLTRLRDDTRGSVFVEAALIMPMIVYMIAGIADYGVTLYQYHTLSTATGAAVRQLIISRGFDHPFTGVLSEFSTWSPNMPVTGNEIQISVEDSAGELQRCTDNDTCKAALDNAAGKQARIILNYECSMTFIPSFASPCPIQIDVRGMVE